MKRFFCIILSVLMVLSLAACNGGGDGDSSVNGNIAAATPTRLLGQLVATDTALNITTTRSIDEDTLRRSISLVPSVSYSLKKTASTVYQLTFNSALAADTLYTLRSVSEQRTLASFAFQTAADFAVASTSPAANATDVSCKSKITFKFTYENVEQLEQSFSIYPAVEGSFSQKGDSCTFTPAAPLAINTRYTVTLNKSVANANGVTLSEDYRLRFTTGINDAADSKFAYIVTEGCDYADSFYSADTPYAAVRQKGMNERTATVSVYRFAKHSDYMNAHKSYLAAPDFSDIDTLISKLTLLEEFSAELVSTSNGDYFSYPKSYEDGYYISSVKIGDSTVYHAFTVSELSVYAITTATDCHVWVNNGGNGGALVGAEVMLDNSYNEKTDGNGVARFTLAQDDVFGRYVIVSHSRSTPYISYLRTDSDLGEQQPLRDYFSGLYTDSKSYNKVDTVNVFGCVVKRFDRAADISSAELKNSWNNSTVQLQLDDNGCFTAALPLSADYGSEQRVMLLVNGVQVGESELAVMSNPAATTAVSAAPIITSATDYSNVALAAEYSSGALRVSTNLLSSAASEGGLNEQYSDIYGRVLYNTNACSLDYSVRVHKIIYTGEKDGSMYDPATGASVDRIKYNQSNTVVSTLDGSTKDGAATHYISYNNTSEEYYYFEIVFTDLFGVRRSYYVNDFYESYLKGGSSDDMLMLTCEGEASSAAIGDELAFTVRRGVSVPDSGRLMLVSVCSRIIGSTVSGTPTATVKITDKYTEGALIYAAYFDGRHSYTVSPYAVQCEPDARELGVSLQVAQQSYTANEQVDISVRVSDGGRAAAATVLVNVYDSRLNLLCDNTAGLEGLYAERSSLSAVYQQTDICRYTLPQQAGGSAGDDKTQTAGFTDYVRSPYFKTVTTDSSGNAKASFTMPDAAAEYTVVAIAVTADGESGMAHGTIGYDEGAFSASIESVITREDSFAVSLQSNEQQTQGTECEFVVTLFSGSGDGSTQLSKQTIKATAGASARADFTTLEPGDYSYSVEYRSSGELQGSVQRSFTVLAAQQPVYTAASMRLGSAAAFNLPEGQMGSVLLYERVYDGLFSALGRLLVTPDSTLSSRVAFLTAQGFLSGSAVSSADTDALYKYQVNGGVSDSAGGAADLRLSARLAAVLGESCSDYLSKTALISYFNGVVINDKSSDTDRDIARFGLAALHCSVLDELQQRAASEKLSDEQRLYVALGLAYAGDFESAAALFEPLRAQLSYKGTAASLNSSDEQTAAAALLCARLSDTATDALMSYLAQNAPDALCDAAYIRYYTPQATDECEVIVNSEADRQVKFARYRIYRYSSSTDLSVIRMSGNGNMRALAIYACAYSELG